MCIFLALKKAIRVLQSLTWTIFCFDVFCRSVTFTSQLCVQGWHLLMSRCRLGPCYSLLSQIMIMFSMSSRWRSLIQTIDKWWMLSIFLFHAVEYILGCVFVSSSWFILSVFSNCSCSKLSTPHVQRGYQLSQLCRQFRVVHLVFPLLIRLHSGCFRGLDIVYGRRSSRTSSLCGAPVSRLHLSGL